MSDRQIILITASIWMLIATAVSSLLIIRSSLGLRRWLDAEPYSSFSPSAELEEIALQQIQEYAQEGKVSSKLNLNVECYQRGETQISKSPLAITNVIREGKGCSDIGPLYSYGDRLFFIEAGDPNEIKVARVSCEGLYIGEYHFAINDETQPQFIDGYLPICPSAFRGKAAAPSYTEYLVVNGKVTKQK